MPRTDVKEPSSYYTLDVNNDPVPCTKEAYDEALKSGRTQVLAHSTTSNSNLTTYFLGLNHDGVAEPLIWVTCIFGESVLAGSVSYYKTKDAAQIGHNAFLKSIQDEEEVAVKDASIPPPPPKSK